MEQLPSFAVMGAGGVGGCFGAALAQSGCPVSFIARGPHLAAIREHGLRVESDEVPLIVNPLATDSPEEVGPVDYVLFCVKLWDTEQAANSCRPLIGENTAVVALQNGVESSQALSDILGRDHVIGGIAEIFATIHSPGIIRRVGPVQVIRFGELDNQVSERAKRLDAALVNAGLGSEIVSDVAVTVWTKFIFLTGLSALTALTRKTIGEIREDQDTRALLKQVMQEVEAVGRANRVALPEDVIENRLAVIDTLSPTARASMANDLVAGRRLELPWLSGGVVRIGKEVGVPTPANAFIQAALKLHANGSDASA